MANFGPAATAISEALLQSKMGLYQRQVQLRQAAMAQVADYIKQGYSPDQASQIVSRLTGMQFQQPGISNPAVSPPGQRGLYEAYAAAAKNNPKLTFGQFYESIRNIQNPNYQMPEEMGSASMSDPERNAALQQTLRDAYDKRDTYEKALLDADPTLDEDAAHTKAVTAYSDRIDPLQRELAGYTGTQTSPSATGSQTTPTAQGSQPGGNQTGYGAPPSSAQDTGATSSAGTSPGFGNDPSMTFGAPSAAGPSPQPNQPDYSTDAYPASMPTGMTPGPQGGAQPPTISTPQVAAAIGSALRQGGAGVTQPDQSFPIGSNNIPKTLPMAPPMAGGSGQTQITNSVPALPGGTSATPAPQLSPSDILQKYQAGYTEQGTPLQNAVTQMRHSLGLVPPPMITPPLTGQGFPPQPTPTPSVQQTTPGNQPISTGPDLPNGQYSTAHIRQLAGLPDNPPPGNPKPTMDWVPAPDGRGPDGTGWIQVRMDVAQKWWTGPNGPEETLAKLTGQSMSQAAAELLQAERMKNTDLQNHYQRQTQRDIAANVQSGDTQRANISADTSRMNNQSTIAAANARANATISNENWRFLQDHPVDGVDPKTQLMPDEKSRADLDVAAIKDLTDRDAMMQTTPQVPGKQTGATRDNIRQQIQHYQNDLQIVYGNAKDRAAGRVTPPPPGGIMPMGVSPSGISPLPGMTQNTATTMRGLLKKNRNDFGNTRPLPPAG